MSYSFIRNNLQYIDCSIPLLSPNPITISLWGKADTSGLALGAFSLIEASTGYGYRIVFAGQVAGNPVRANLFSSSGTFISAPGVGFSLNQWHHVCFVISGTTRTMYLDSNQISNSITATFPSFDKIMIGLAANVYMGGFISDVAVWSAELNTDEIKSLRSSFSPDKIRTQSLEFHAPLIKNLYEYTNNRTLSNINASTTSEHNRIYL